MIMDERTGPNNCNGPEFCPRLCGPVRVLVLFGPVEGTENTDRNYGSRTGHDNIYNI